MGEPVGTYPSGNLSRSENCLTRRCALCPVQRTVKKWGNIRKLSGQEAVDGSGSRWENSHSKQIDEDGLISSISIGGDEKALKSFVQLFVTKSQSKIDRWNRWVDSWWTLDCQLYRCVDSWYRWVDSWQPRFRHEDRDCSIFQQWSSLESSRCSSRRNIKRRKARRRELMFNDLFFLHFVTATSDTSSCLQTSNFFFLCVYLWRSIWLVR